MYFPKYAMFFDNHTMKACPDTGHDFDGEVFGEKLREAGVDLVGFHAKCNQGFCYYNTTEGIRHPSLPEGFDMFGAVVEACKKRNIRVTAYLNCGLSHEEALLHSNWNNISPEGRILHTDLYSKDGASPYLRVMCLNSPYRDHFFTLVREVMEQYDVAGFLFDSFNAFPCICPYCIAGMKEMGMNVNDPGEIKRFAYLSALRMAEDLSSILRSKNPEYLHYYLGLAPRDNARIGSYMECECLPTNPVWGYDFLPIRGRFLRTLTKGPVLNMTGRFNDWGDFGTLRSKHAVEYDLFFGLANGMRPNIGDHLLPSGKINDAVFKRVKEIYKDIKHYEKYYENAVPLTDIGVIMPDGIPATTPALVGVTRMLSELKAQFEFADAESDLEKYSLLILPDSVKVEEKLYKRLKFYLDKGKLLLTGNSGFDAAGERFMLEKETGVRYKGDISSNPLYFRMEGAFAEGLPEMPLGVQGKGYMVEVSNDVKVAGHFILPYYSRHCDGSYSYYYTPPGNISPYPFATFNGRTVCCPVHLFEAYYKGASLELRQVLKLLLEKLLPKPLLRTGEKLPSFARAFVTESNEGRMVHLLNYLPELRGEMLIVEEALPAENVTIQLRMDGRKAERLIQASSGKELSFTVKEDILEAVIPAFSGYELLVIQ